MTPPIQAEPTAKRRAAPIAIGSLWRAWCLDAAVDDGVSAFACLVEDAHCAQAVGHLLGEPALDRGCLGKLGGSRRAASSGQAMRTHRSTETSRRPSTTQPCRRNAWPWR